MLFFLQLLLLFLPFILPYVAYRFVLHGQRANWEKGIRPSFLAYAGPPLFAFMLLFATEFSALATVLYLDMSNPENEGDNYFGAMLVMGGLVGLYGVAFALMGVRVAFDWRKNKRRVFATPDLPVTKRREWLGITCAVIAAAPVVYYVGTILIRPV
jgi:hypothetical protein